MAKGRQIYLQAEEIEHLAAMVEWKMIEVRNDREEMIKSDLKWAISDIRMRGKKPERSDFDPRLPDPETDYRAALERWAKKGDRLTQLVRMIRESRADQAKLQSLMDKLFYYG